MNRNKGIALIQVLLISAMLSIFAMYLTNTARGQVAVAQWLNDKSHALVALHSAEAELNFLLLTETRKYPAENEQNESNIVRRWNFHGQVFKLNETVSVKIQDQAGLLSVNRPDTSLLVKLLVEQGAEQEQAVAIVDSLLDWQDIDSIPRNNGNESANYGSSIRNGKVTNIEELIYVVGMNTYYLDIFQQVMSLHKLEIFNPLLAPDILLRAMFGQMDAEQIIALRIAGQLTPQTFQNITNVKENDETSLSFNFSNNISIEFESKVGESIVNKQILMNYNRYVKGDSRPLNIFLNRG